MTKLQEVLEFIKKTEGTQITNRKISIAANIGYAQTAAMYVHTLIDTGKIEIVQTTRGWHGGTTYRVVSEAE